MAKDLSDAFKQIEKQSKQMAIDAMREVANKAHKMAIQTAKNCLAQYYSNYKPKRYKRTKQLKKAIRHKMPKETNKGDVYTISFSIIYDANKLKGLYRSNSWYHQSGDKWIPVMATWAPDHIVKGMSHDMRQGIRDDWGQNNGIPEPEWILNNYLQGIHPWGKTDKESTDSVMTKFFQDLHDEKAGDMIYAEMQDAIVGFLRKYGGGK